MKVGRRVPEIRSVKRMTQVSTVGERDYWIKQEEEEDGGEAEGEFGSGSGIGGGIHKEYKLHMARAKAIDSVSCVGEGECFQRQLLGRMSARWDGEGDKREREEEIR